MALQLESTTEEIFRTIHAHPTLSEVVREAALAAVRELGVGSGAVRTIAGTMSLHEQLERDLAEFKGTEATLVFQSGFTANTGVTVDEADSVDITAAELAATDADDPPTALTWMVDRAPLHGTLARAGTGLSAGESFTSTLP